MNTPPSGHPNPYREEFPTDSRAWPCVSIFEAAFPKMDWRRYSPPHLQGCAAYAGVLAVVVEPASRGWRASIQGNGEAIRRLHADTPEGLTEPLRVALVQVYSDIRDAL